MKQKLQSKNDDIKNLQKENQKLLSEIKNPVTSIKIIRDIPFDGEVVCDILEI